MNDSQIAEIQLFWKTYDEANKIAEQKVYTRFLNGGVEGYQDACKELPGWKSFRKYSLALKDFLLESRKSVLTNTCDKRFLNLMPDNSGSRIIEGFDMKQAVGVIREDYDLFLKIVGL